MAEIITCGSCQKTLQIPEQYLGQLVQCPHCKNQFVAAATAVSSAPVPVSASAGKSESTPTGEKKKRFDDEDEGDHRRRRRFEDEEEDDDLDIGRGSRLRRNLPPNRSGLIMALGLISLIGGWMFCVPVVVGPIAWILAQMDLRAIRAGEMDPTNESMIRTGQVCGIISTVILILGAGLVFLFVLAGLFG